MRPPSRPYEPLTARYGAVGQAGEWRIAIDAYYHDRLPEAYRIAESLGAGFGGAALSWYRMIEGEALTRERAHIVTLNPNLTVEYAQDEIALGEVHFQAIENATNHVAGRLGWDFSMPVRTTILLAEVDAPWHGARYGYCVDKYPYDKICIPYAAATDPHRLYEVMAHEFTHVVTLNLTQGRVPHWLDEGLAMLMSGEAAPASRHWQEPAPLNAAFEADRRDGEGLARSHDAYLQSVRLVRYLHANGGDEKLAQLLRAFTNNSFLTEIRINLLGEPSVEEALHEVYGFGQRELFEAAR